MTVPMLTVPRGSAVKDIYATWRAFFGIPEHSNGAPRDLKDMGRQPADEAWVYRCMDIRASEAAGVPLRVQVRDGSGWTDVDGTSDSAGADLQFLLDDVNPAWEGAGLQFYTEGGAAIHGGSYWRKVRGRLGGPPQELYWLSGADVEPVINPGDPFPTAYNYRPNGTVGEQYLARDVIAHRDTVNLENPYKLLSPLSAARNSVAAGKAIVEWNLSLLNNWGVPAGAWVADKDAELSPSDTSLIKRVLNAARGPKNQGKAPVLPGGLTWVPLSLSQKDADWLGTGKVSRMMVCAAEGVPLVLAGDDEKNSVYGNTRDAERWMWRGTLIPAMDRRASRIDSWLVPDFDKTRRHLRVRYDYSGIEALQPAPAENMAAWMQAVDHGVPLNRMIARFGMGAPVEGGNEARVFMRTGDMPLNDNGAIANIPATGAPKPQPTAEPANPRPAEYNTQANPKSLDFWHFDPKLYRNEAVKAYIANGDPSALSALVPEHLIPSLAEGIRRRESVEQITARLNEVQP